jgi:hypothetical protein
MRLKSSAPSEFRDSHFDDDRHFEAIVNCREWFVADGILAAARGG